MSMWHFYDLATGLFSGAAFQGDNDELQAQLAHHGNGVGAYEGDVDPLSQRMDTGTGALIDYQPPAPAADAYTAWAWGESSKRWSAVKTIEGLKTDRWATVKAAREAALAAPKTTSVGTFDCDPDSQNNLNKVIALVQLAVARGEPDTANYTLSNNVRQSFTLAQLQTAALEIGVQEQAIYDQYDAVRTAIEAATTAETIAAVVSPA